VNGAASGMMFSIPAIFILGYGDRFDPVILTFGCIAGAFLGIAFIVPLRKHMIDYERLTYPGGVAVATILKSPGAGVRKAIILVAAALISATVHAITIKTGVSNWNVGGLIGMPEFMNGIWYLSLMTIGVGFIAGRGGIAFIVGGFVAYWFLSPMLSVTGSFPLDEAGQVISSPEPLRLMLYRPLGIGMLIGGAIMGVILAAPSSQCRKPRRSKPARPATRCRSSCSTSPWPALSCSFRSCRSRPSSRCRSRAASRWPCSARCGSGWPGSSCPKRSAGPTGRRSPG
jgi:hypothetical protein